MNIKILTLPHAIERQEKIKVNFEIFNLKFDFIYGIEFNDCVFDKRYDNNFYVICRNQSFLINEEKIISYTNRKWIRFGEIGAYLAHYFIWKDFLKTSDDYIIICEDDAQPKSDLKELNNFFKNSNIDFLNLQAVTAHYQYKKQLFIPPIINHAYEGIVEYKQYIPLLCEGLAAYAITKKAAKILCEYIEANGFVGPNDCLTAQLAIQNILPIYSPYNIDDYFLLDKQTYNVSYTHTGEFKTYMKMNNITLDIKI